MKNISKLELKKFNNQKIINNYFFYLNSLNGEAEENILFTSRKKNL